MAQPYSMSQSLAIMCKKLFQRWKLTPPDVSSLPSLLVWVFQVQIRHSPQSPPSKFICHCPCDHWSPPAELSIVYMAPFPGWQPDIQNCCLVHKHFKQSEPSPQQLSVTYSLLSQLPVAVSGWAHLGPTVQGSATRCSQTNSSPVSGSRRGSLFWARCSSSLLPNSYGVFESLFVWLLNYNQFALGDPTRGYCPDNISPRITKPSTTLWWQLMKEHLDIPMENFSCLSLLWL